MQCIGPGRRDDVVAKKGFEEHPKKFIRYAIAFQENGWEDLKET